MTSRLLSVIPAVLWDAASKVLTLPKALSDCYIDRIDSRHLRELAKERSGKHGAIGGAGQVQADTHFAQNFDQSAARTLLAMLDPRSDLGPTSDHLITSAAGTTLALTDAPCGAGAAALTFLSTIAALRKAKVLPREPLDVALVGGEFSPEAIQHAEALLTCLKPALEEQAIFVQSTLVLWNVTDSPSTVNLISTCIRCSTNEQRKLLIVANFNGFLARQSKFADAKLQLSQLFQFAGGGASRAVWIEPAMNGATAKGGMFAMLMTLFQSLRRHARPAALASEIQPAFSTEARFSRPLEPGTSQRVTLAVMPIDLRVESA